MATGFKRTGDHYVVRLDEQERAIVVGLMEQVHDLVRPDDEAAATDDPFDEIVSGLGGSLGVSLAEEDQLPDVPDSPAGLADRGLGTSGPRDPALDRLFPTSNREDEQVAAEFRRLTEQGLRSRKAENLRVAMSALGTARRDKIEISEAEAMATLVALTDVRLVLGERLGLRTDEDAARIDVLLEALDRDDPMAYALAVYDFLTWLQETLAQVLLP